MNVFAVDPDPVEAARALCDRHVPRMALESAQIACTVARSHGLPAPYKATHPRHPCVLWAGAAAGNLRWLVEHGLALCDEYRHRFGREHASESVLRWAAAALPSLPLPPGRTPFAQVMPDPYRGDDSVEAYRRFYRGEKARFARWTHGRAPPEWWR